MFPYVVKFFYQIPRRAIAMKNLKAMLVGVVAALMLTAPAWASPKTVTLNVPGMTCPACPVTVRKALEKVSAVSKIDVLYEKKQVVVTFDDSKTNTDALVKATTNAGYPSQPEKTAK
jgi:mercuric ion binding protein